MNDYELLLSKLKAMQLQGYSMRYLLDEWRTGLPDAISYLGENMVMAVLRNDLSEIRKLKQQLNHIKTLDKTIKNGLLEHTGVAE